MSSSSAPKTENKKGDFFARPWEPPSRGAPMGQSPHQVTTILTQGDHKEFYDALDLSQQLGKTLKAII